MAEKNTRGAAGSSLSAFMHRQGPPRVEPDAPPAVGAATARPAGGTHKQFNTELHEDAILELRGLAVERSRQTGKKVTVKDLTAEAMNDLFQKYGRPPVA